MTDSQEHFELMRHLESDRGIAASPKLADWDIHELYAAMMDKLAQPGPDGSPSPFSDRSPLSGHGRLMEAIAFSLDMAGHDLNAVPDYTWVQMFRMLGMERAQAEYPLINITFERAREALDRREPLIVPMGYKIRSSRRVDGKALTATTRKNLVVDGTNKVGTVLCRIDLLGKISGSLPKNTLSLPSSRLPGLKAIRSPSKLVSSGRDRGSLAEMMKVVRDRHRQGPPLGRRLVSLPDWHDCLKEFGATKVNIVSDSYGRTDHWAMGIQAVVYPRSLVGPIQERLRSPRKGDPLLQVGQMYDIIPARIVGVTGVVQIRTAHKMKDEEVFNLVARAIRDNINPPHGMWGDREFAKSLASVLERIQGIYAVPRMELFAVEGGDRIPLSEFKPTHDTLFQVKSTLNVMSIN